MSSRWWRGIGIRWWWYGGLYGDGEPDPTDPEPAASFMLADIAMHRADGGASLFSVSVLCFVKVCFDVMG